MLEDWSNTPRNRLQKFNVYTKYIYTHMHIHTYIHIHTYWWVDVMKFQQTGFKHFTHNIHTQLVEDESSNTYPKKFYIHTCI